MPSYSSISRFLLLWFYFLGGNAAFAQEMRGWWVDAFNNGFRTSSQITQLIADARSAKVNALFVQVRKRGDAFYNSNYEPKATEVSPQSFDPLADLLTKARTGGARIQIHAWIVTYNIWNSQTGTPTQPTHPYRVHPEWLTQRHDAVTWDTANYAFDQAHPQVQEYTYNVCMDLLSRYDVDGLHFDYIRYTDANATANNQPWGYHPVAIQRFRQLTGRTDTPAPTDTQWLQFRRDQVSALVRRVYLNAWKVRKTARISAALIAFTSAPASQSIAAWQARDAYSRTLQDWRSWLEEGILDTAIPMVYRDDSNATRSAEYDAWLDWMRLNQFSRSTAMGQGAYLNSIANSLSQIKDSRLPAATGANLTGLVGYSYANLALSPATKAEFIAAVTNPTTANLYDPGGAPVYAIAATVPEMPWKLAAATKGHVMGRVTNAAGFVDGASILISVPGGLLRTATSDANGFWGSVDLPAGSYTVTYVAPGFTSQPQPLVIAAGNVTEMPTVNLSERPLDFAVYSWNATTRIGNFTWYSKPGKTYRIETSFNLTVWGTLVNGYASQGATTSWTSWSLPSAGRRYFRIVEE